MAERTPIQEEIFVHSTAEYLAKEDDFTQESLAYYLDVARRYHNGDTAIVPDQHHELISIHGLMVADDEAGVLERHPEYGANYAASDQHQVQTAWSPNRNLDYLLEHGVAYIFDSNKVGMARELVRPDEPQSRSLIREKIVNANGFDSRLNYMYHDALDHGWFFEFARSQGLHERYDDFFESTGRPFDGLLFSKQAELLSGVGFSARQFLTDPEYYGAMALQPETTMSHMRAAGDMTDTRITEAIETLGSDDEIASWAGFVIKGATANLLFQRRKDGAVKRLFVASSGALENSGEVISLLDPRYLAFMVDSVKALSGHKKEYIEAQYGVNLGIEAAVRRYTRTGLSVGNLAIMEAPDSGNIDPETARLLRDRMDLSISYYGLAS